MVTVLALIGVAVVLFLAAVLSTREGAVLADAPPDAADVVLPPGPVQPEDVAAVRFSLAPRGYRMSEVDDVLERLAAELADRDRRLALLEATIQGGTTPAPDQPAAAPAVDVVEAGEQDLPVPPPPPVEPAAAPAPIPEVAHEPPATSPVTAGPAVGPTVGPAAWAAQPPPVPPAAPAPEPAPRDDAEPASVRVEDQAPDRA